jgi:hypothetical protein
VDEDHRLSANLQKYALNFEEKKLEGDRHAGRRTTTEAPAWANVRPVKGVRFISVRREPVLQDFLSLLHFSSSLMV